MEQRTGLVAGIALFGVLVSVLVLPPTVGAAEQMEGAKVTLSLTKNYTPSTWTKEVGYGKRAASKLGFGLKNLLLGWTDLFVEPKQATSAGENVFKGIGVGLKDAIENEVGGALHIITFPLTEVDVPLPEGGTQLLSQ